MTELNKNNTKYVVLSDDTPHGKLFADAPLYRKKVVVSARQVTAPETLHTVLSNGLVETSRDVPSGHWVITNPGGEEYAVSDEKFRNRYEALGNGLFRAKGIIRAYLNPTGHAVRINAPWGEAQYGDVDCLFAAAVDENLAPSSDRYIIGGEEFKETYENFKESEE